MLISKFKFPILLFCLFCFSCGDDEPPMEQMEEEEDTESLTWTANGFDFESLESEVFGININGFFVTGEDASEWGILLDMGEAPVAVGNVYTMDENSDTEMYMYDNRGARWTSDNDGGSGTVNITSFELVEDMLFVDAIVEGTFSGTLTLSADTTVCRITNGAFRAEL